MVWFIAVGIILLSFYVGFILYINYFFTNIVINNFYNVATVAQEKQVIYSIIIPVRNEEINITTLLTDLLLQQVEASCFEIIVVDDYSDDGTLLRLQQANNINLKWYALINENNTGIGKKNAIQFGIQKALGKYIITVDADVKLGAGWLQAIHNFIHAHPNAAAIAAPVFMKGSNTMLDNFQEIDFITMQGITAVVLHKKWFAMCNGANFIYKKAVFNEVEGFANINTLASGDDMLLLQKIMDKYPADVYYLLDRQATATTKTEPTIKKFLQQRIRWASKATYYNNSSIKLVLLLVLLLNSWFFITLVFSIFYAAYVGVIMLAILFVKAVIEFTFVQKVSVFFDRKISFTTFVLLQPLHMLYIVISAFFGFMPKYTWKGRVTK
jgi:cellulose synthase/poly-beta-1,6-N-acetylglucosamine synthase-like glycosyltransferase